MPYVYYSRWRQRAAMESQRGVGSAPRLPPSLERNRRLLLALLQDHIEELKQDVFHAVAVRCNAWQYLDVRRKPESQTQLIRRPGIRFILLVRRDDVRGIAVG